MYIVSTYAQSDHEHTRPSADLGPGTRTDIRITYKEQLGNLSMIRKLSDVNTWTVHDMEESQLWSSMQLDRAARVNFENVMSKCSMPPTYERSPGYRQTHARGATSIFVLYRVSKCRGVTS